MVNLDRTPQSTKWVSVGLPSAKLLTTHTGFKYFQGFRLMKPDPLFSCELVEVCIAQTISLYLHNLLLLILHRGLLPRAPLDLCYKQREAGWGLEKVILKQKHVV